jgi:hypothetical protein
MPNIPNVFSAAFPSHRRKTLLSLPVVCLLVLIVPALSAQNIGPTTVKVHTALGGFILGYDIDQNGTEGVLAESLVLSDGSYDVAVESFDQTTGAILNTIAEQKETKNDFIAWGVVGTSVGLIEEEKSKGLFVGKRLYSTINPLSGNKLTGTWTPSLTKDQIISSVAASQGSSNTAVLAFNNNNSFSSFVFSSNVVANTFGPQITLTDTVFDFNDSPVMAQNTVLNTAVVAASDGGVLSTPQIAVVNLSTGSIDEFEGMGLGFANGIAVDSNTNMACTTTEIDFSAEFIDLTTMKAKRVVLQGATSQSNSGGAVAIDPVNQLFLIGQEFSSVDPAAGSSILVYDEQGHFVEAINGLKLPASPAYMAINPATRTGFVIITPALTALQQFTY